ncbi:S-layer homology domain-containing protein [Leucobacter celer]|uniref:S-layer homology domain-containing protein n=1 Tax=Leucobacter celer TaxID=668625 RepID=UPI0012FCDC05|nr:S-layer homology domain-containing protein [Leucobacter celer]
MHTSNTAVLGRRLGRVLALLLGTALVATLVVEPLPPRAEAENGTAIELPDFSIPILPGTDPAADPVEVIVQNGIIQPDSPVPAPQCVSDVAVLGSLVTNTCTGGDVRQPLTMLGTPPATSVTEVFSNPEAAAALGWLVPRAEETLRTLYDLPADNRIRKYARSQLASLITTEVQALMTRYVYGDALEAHETSAVEYVRDQLRQRQFTSAVAAKQLYDDYLANPCTFRPPTAPEGIDAAQIPALPQELRAWCQLRTPSLFRGAPIPTAQSFTAWGAFQAGSEDDLTALASDAVFSEQVRQAQIGTFMAAGLGVSVAAGATLGALVAVGAVNISIIIGVVFPHALKSSFVVGSATGASVASSFSTVAAVTGPAIIILVSLAMIAVSIWQFVSDAAVGTTLSRNAAGQGVDVLRLDEERAAREGVAYQPDIPAFEHFQQHPPQHSGAEARDQINALLFSKSLAESDGATARPLPALWQLSERSDITDYRWTLDGQETDVVSLKLPHDRGSQELMFRDGWLLSRSNSGSWVPTTAFEYVDSRHSDPAAAASVASRAWWPDDTSPTKRRGGFTSLTAATEPDEPFTVAGQLGALTVVLADGSHGLLRLLPPESITPRITPSASGVMLPNRALVLSANPLTDEGAYQPAFFTDAARFSYEWRVYAPGDETPSVHSGFRLAFAPDRVGQHIAEVTMTRLDAPDTDPVHGRVEFTVGAPEIQIPVAELHDNGYDGVELSLRLAANVPIDEFTVEVQWPKRAGEEESPSMRAVLPCSADPVSCAVTVPAGTLSHELHPDTDLSQPVIVSIANQWGTTAVRELTIDSTRRFSIEPAAPSAHASARINWHGQQSAQLQIPIATDGTATIATLAAGDLPLPEGRSGSSTVAFALGDGQLGRFLPLVRETGMLSLDWSGSEWELNYRGRLTANDIGTFSTPITIEAVNGAERVRNTFMLDVEVVPAYDDRRVPLIYDAALLADGYPDTNLIHEKTGKPVFVVDVLGGTEEESTADAGDGGYSGNICFWMQSNTTGEQRDLCEGYEQLRAGAAPHPSGLPVVPIDRLFPEGLTGASFRIEAWLPDEETARTRYLFSVTDADDSSGDDDDDETPVTPPQPVFRDVTPSSKFAREIHWMAQRGISTGISRIDARGRAYRVYEPQAPVTREAMAAFLYRSSAPKDYRAPRVSHFADVQPGDKFYREISWMWDSKLSTGHRQASGKPTYRPKAHVTREALAVFLHRRDATPLSAPPQASPFADVHPRDRFFRQISWMNETGISTGIRQPGGRPKYAPKSSVSREAMAAFLYRADSRASAG